MENIACVPSVCFEVLATDVSAEELVVFVFRSQRMQVFDYMDPAGGGRKLPHSVGVYQSTRQRTPPEYLESA